VLFLYNRPSSVWSFGYRQMEAEIDTGGNDTEITMAGPVVSYAHKF